MDQALVAVYRWIGCVERICGRRRGVIVVLRGGRAVWASWWGSCGCNKRLNRRVMGRVEYGYDPCHKSTSCSIAIRVENDADCVARHSIGTIGEGWGSTQGGKGHL